MYKLKYLKYKNKYLQQRGGKHDRIKGDWVTLQLGTPFAFRYNATVHDIHSGNIIAEFILRSENSTFTIRKTTIQQEQQEQDDTNSEKELKKDVIMYFIDKELSNESVTPFGSRYPRNQTNRPLINGIINIIAQQIYNNYEDIRTYITTKFPSIINVI